MIKLIIFDLSGVCYVLEEPYFLKIFAKRHGLDYKELDDYYQEMLEKAEEDKIDIEYAWEKIFNTFKVRENFDEIVEEMLSYRKPIKETLELIGRLRKKYKTAYITNYARGYWNRIEKKFKMDEYFDFGVVSYQIKARKPAAKGFLTVLEHFKVKAKEAVYIDDSEKKLMGAVKLGINGILFKDKRQLIKDLKKLGVSV